MIYIYRCHANEHKFGTGLMVFRNPLSLVLMLSTSDCVQYVPRGNSLTIYSLIYTHAPTEDKYDDQKDAVYELLNSTYTLCPTHDIKLAKKNNRNIPENMSPRNF